MLLLLCLGKDRNTVKKKVVFSDARPQLFGEFRGLSRVNFRKALKPLEFVAYLGFGTINC